MTTRDTIVVIAVVLMLAGGAVVYRNVAEEKAAVRRALADYAERAGLDSDLVLAIAAVESRFRLGAINRAGRDGLRGGAYGPTQITETTARAHGYTGPMLALTQDANLAAFWTVKILNARPGGPPTTPEDVAAWWNGGHASIASVPSDGTERTEYLPRLRAAYEEELAS